MVGHDLAALNTNTRTAISEINGVKDEETQRAAAEKRQSSQTAPTGHDGRPAKPLSGWRYSGSCSSVRV